jgi:uncharacterized protein
MFARLPILVAALALGACGGNSAQYLFDPVPTDTRIRTSVQSVVIQDVTVPEYANNQEIAVLGSDGAVRTDSDVLWAEIPSDAISNGIARSLSEITGATVAADPWPLEAIPDMRLEVRIERMIADDAGRFVFAGQYFLSPDGRNFRSATGRFNIVEPMDTNGYPGIARAGSRAVTRLSEQIAAAMAR